MERQSSTASASYRRFSDEELEQIRAMRRQGDTVRGIAKFYQVAPGTVSLRLREGYKRGAIP